MSAFAAIARSGVASVLRHPLRSAVTVACVVAVVLPYVAGLGVSRGLLDQVDESLALGPELTVTGRRFGRAAPLPKSFVEDVRAALKDVPGADVSARITGEIHLGRDDIPTVLVGVPRDRLPPSAQCIDGAWFRGDDRAGAAGGSGALELVVGRTLSKRLGVRAGSTMLPFYENERGQRVATVVGVFRADVPLWESNLVLTSLDSAAEVFAQEGLVTEILVRCPAAYVGDARRAISALRDIRAMGEGPRGHDGPPDSVPALGTLRPAVTSRDDAAALVPEGILHREGVFGVHWLLAFAVGIPLVLVTSGIGLTERRREIGLLKALGWQTDEVLLRAAAESLLLALASSALAVLLAWIWLVALNARGIAGLFLDGVDADPAFRVPFRLTPVPALLATIASFSVVAVGTLVSTWRTASAAPAEALR